MKLSMIETKTTRRDTTAHFDKQLSVALEDIGRRLRIGYDLDDVLADLDQVLRQRLSLIINKYVPKGDRTSFYFEDIPALLAKLGMTKEQLGPLVVDSFKHINMEQLPSLSNAVSTIKQLQRDGHTIIIITARSKKSQDVTRSWLKRVGIGHVPVYFAGSGPIRSAPKDSKAKIARLLKLDYFIDDSMDNINQFFRTGQHKLTQPIVYDQPWNAAFKGPRLGHHGETLDLLNKLE